MVNSQRTIEINTAVSYQAIYFFTITEALWPPKPKVLLNAALTVLCCALLKVKFNFGIQVQDHR